MLPLSVGCFIKQIPLQIISFPERVAPWPYIIGVTSVIVVVVVVVAAIFVSINIIIIRSFSQKSGILTR